MTNAQPPSDETSASLTPSPAGMVTAEEAANGDAALAAALRAIYGDTPLRLLATAVLPRVEDR